MWISRKEWLAQQQLLAKQNKDIQTALSNLSKDLNAKMEKIMSEIDDLKTAASQVLQDIADETAELAIVAQALKDLSTQPRINPADVSAVANQLTAAHQGIRDAITAAQAAVNTPPAAPATGP